jgi:hypothetical protein
MAESVEYLAFMRVKGVYFFAYGGRLYWHAPAQLTPEDAAQAQALKAELLALVADEALETLCALAAPKDAAFLREERAGILEFEGDMSRLEAELRAGMNRNRVEAA